MKESDIHDVLHHPQLAASASAAVVVAVVVAVDYYFAFPPPLQRDKRVESQSDQ